MADTGILIEGLNELMSRFCFEYITDFRGGPAAIRAGYSEKGADVTASKLLRTPKVREAIRDLLKADVNRYQVTREQNISWLKAIASGRIDNVMSLQKQKITWEEENAEGKKVKKTAVQTVLSLKDFSELTEEQLYCIEAIEQTRYGVKVKLKNTAEAIDMLNKHLGFYEKDKPNPADYGAVLVIPSNNREKDAKNDEQ